MRPTCIASHMWLDTFLHREGRKSSGSDLSEIHSLRPEKESKNVMTSTRLRMRADKYRAVACVTDDEYKMWPETTIL